MLISNPVVLLVVLNACLKHPLQSTLVSEKRVDSNSSPDASRKLLLLLTICRWWFKIDGQTRISRTEVNSQNCARKTCAMPTLKFFSVCRFNFLYASRSSEYFFVVLCHLRSEYQGTPNPISVRYFTSQSTRSITEQRVR